PATSHDANNTALTSTLMGEYFKLDAKQINRILFDLGWIEREGKGWKPSALGEKLKAQKILYQKKVPYVVWHQDICKSRILQNAVSEFISIEVAPPSITEPTSMPEEAADKTEDFREKFPPLIRASDGHMVRSRAEAMIDAWLYENRIVHAYERLVRVEQKMYCDFYLPEYDLYVEFWGLESNPKYKARKEKKLEIYRQNELKLIEIKNEDINNLDDYLTGQLVKFGYKAK
ncbi:MAG: glycerol kinase, partial [Betaproteobacteria bacterium]|nr:glycerol kinase [Betaproteobacteria bacterium]